MSILNRIVLVSCFVVTLLCGLTLLAQDPARVNPQLESSIQNEFKSLVQPIIKKHCVRCHGVDVMESGIRLDQLDGSLEDRQLFLWDKIRQQISRSAMPPEDEPQLSKTEKRTLAAWLERSLNLARTRPTAKNGSTRRLTVSQYRNALKELLGTAEELGDRLPPDAVSKDGFANNEKTMLLSPLLIEAYFEIAEKALDACIVDENLKPTIQNFRMDFGRKINKQPYPRKLILGANSHLLANEDFVVSEGKPNKSFEFKPFKMQTRFRFIEGYQGNSTVRGWKDFDSLYHAVFACMRGNAGYPKGLPYQVVPRGLLLRPAIPSAELFGVESTYGPKANFKVSLRELPDHGNFRVKVQAAKYVGGLLLERGEKTISGTDPIVVDHRGKTTAMVNKPGIYQVNIHNQPPSYSRTKPDRTRLEKELVGSWSFDNGFQSHNEKKFLQGTPMGGAILVDSPFGKAVSLDGKDDSVVVKRHPSMDVKDGDFTVAAWIRPQQLKQGGIVCLGKYSWTHGWYFDMPNNQGVLRLETASPNNQPNGTVQSRPGVIRANKWQHVAAVVRRGENQTKLYLNGYEVAQGTIAKTVLDNPGVDLYIGRIQESLLFKGQIDDVRFYRRALDVAELVALLDKGKKFLQPPPREKPTRLDLVINDKEHGRRQLTGTLHQPAFAYVRLAKGKLELETSYAGKQKVSRIELVRVPDQSELAKRYADFEKRSPLLGVHLGLRRDCGSTLAPVGRPVEVSNPEFREFVFRGAIQNYPNPNVEKNNVNYLAGVREIGTRSEFTDGRDRPQLLIKSIEFEGPYYDSWPPATHRAIFIDSTDKENPLGYARQIIKHFAARAFRRPVSSKEVDGLMNVFESSYSQSNDFSASIKDALLVVLTSPPFLFLLEESQTPKPEPLTDYELASKLSFFLWDSPPDQLALELAIQGRLRSKLDDEVARMVAHPRFENFCEIFCSQWLNLDKLDVVEIDRKRFPRLTRDTRKELRREPVEFVRYLIQHNLPARNLVESEFLVANEITASYYELPTQPENGFRFSVIEKHDAALGGLLGQAGILAGLSDGRESNPIKRGAWLARKIIGEPPDDPPPNVPELGEDTSHLPLHERLAVHRNQKGCAQCHAGIDPWGLPLEEFDASGRFRKKNGLNSGSVLPDKTEVNGFLELKKYLANDRLDQVAFSFSKHLATYAIGRSLTYNEIESLKQQCVKLKKRNYRLQEIVLMIAKSKFFLEK